MFLNLNERFAGVFVDGGEEEEELLHPLLGLHVVWNQSGVEEPLDQQPVLDPRHVVAVQQFIFYPLHRVPCRFGNVVWVSQVFVVDHSQTNHRFFANLELLIKGSFLEI